MTRPSRPESAAWGLSPREWSVVLVGTHLLLGLVLFDPTLFTGGDNAGYMILGDALRSGAGYRDLYLPDAPLHAKYPPGYPVALALLGFGGGLQVFKLFSLLCTAAVVWLTHRLARRRLGGKGAVAAAGLVAVNPVLLEYSHYELSEALFVAAVMAALLAYTARREGWVRGLGASVGAFLVRTAGLPLLAAAWLYHLGRREWRRLAAAVAAGGAAAGGWAAYQAAAGRGGEGYLHQLIMRNPYDPAAGTVGPAELVARATRNLWLYTSEVLPRSILGEPLSPEGGMLAAILGLAVAGLALWGWLAACREEVGVAELFLPLYAALIVLWPEQWTDRRFLLPLLPLFLIYVVRGLRVAAGRWIAGEKGIGAAVAGTLLLATPGLASAALQAPERIRCTTAHWRGEPCVAAGWTSFYDAASWAGSNTPEDAVVANRKPRIFYWISGRRGDVYPYSRSTKVVLDGLREMGADYVVVDQLFSTTAAYLIPAVQARSDRFEAVYSGGTPRTFILRLRPEPASADASGGGQGHAP